MSVTSIDKDPERLTMTITAEFAVGGRARVAAVGRPAPARALVGAADVPGDRATSTTCSPGGQRRLLR